ncbi:MAG: aminotransferase class I/II-fold pyridoxal phosphate-dependent enzyme, partial [Myxococcota bacterium]
ILRRHSVVALSDEIYAPLHASGYAPSLAEFYPERTLISGGLSKWCGAGGWRLGTLMIPDALSELRAAVVTAASETFTSVSAPIQWAACTAYAPDPSMADYLSRSRRVLRAVANHCARALRTAGARVHDSEGGFYLLPDFSGAQHLAPSSDALCAELLDAADIACLPGTAFGRRADELSLRIAFVDFDGARALAEWDEKEDSERFVASHCPRIVTAMSQLISTLSPKSGRL